MDVEELFHSGYVAVLRSRCRYSGFWRHSQTEKCQLEVYHTMDTVPTLIAQHFPDMQTRGVLRPGLPYLESALAALD